MLAPVFLSDYDRIRESLRISDDPTDEMNRQLEDAMSKARIGLFDNLGSARVATLAALPSGGDNPSTDNEILRLKAEQTELSWIRMELLRAAPHLLIDGAAAGQVWNEMEPRDTFSREVNKQIERLWDEIMDALPELAGEAPEIKNVTVRTFEPDTTPERAGRTLEFDI